MHLTTDPLVFMSNGIEKWLIAKWDGEKLVSREVVAGHRDEIKGLIRERIEALELEMNG